MGKLRRLALYGMAFGAGVIACTCYLALRKTDGIDEDPFSDDSDDDEMWDDDLDDDDTVFDDLDSIGEPASELDDVSSEDTDEYEAVSDGIGVGYGDRLFRLAYGVSREDAIMFIMSNSSSYKDSELASFDNGTLGDTYISVKENSRLEVSNK